MKFILKPLLMVIFVTNFNLPVFSKTYNIQGQSFDIYTPKNWQSAKDMFGAHLTLLGPYKDGRRSVVSIDVSPLSDFKFNEKQLNSSQAKYREQRTEFMSKSNGKAIKFYKYEKLKWRNIKEVHTIGYYYSLMENNFHERNYFFNCKGKLYTITTLMTDKQLNSDGEDLSKVLESVSCK